MEFTNLNKGPKSRRKPRWTWVPWYSEDTAGQRTEEAILGAIMLEKSVLIHGG